jgi:hypothetical protein
MDPTVQLPSNPSENGATDILAATLLVITISTIVVLARVYVRVFSIRSVGWDVSLSIFTPCFCYPSSCLIWNQANNE